MTKLIFAVLIAVTAAACQTEAPRPMFELDAASAIAEARCQRYADCAFDGAAGEYYDRCVYWTQIAICEDGRCADDSVTDGNDVDACVAALSVQGCRQLLDTTEEPSECDAWQLRSSR